MPAARSKQATAGRHDASLLNETPIDSIGYAPADDTPWFTIARYGHASSSKRNKTGGKLCRSCLLDDISRMGWTLGCHFVGRRKKPEKALRSSSPSCPV